QCGQPTPQKKRSSTAGASGVGELGAERASATRAQASENDTRTIHPTRYSRRNQARHEAKPVDELPCIAGEPDATLVPRAVVPDEALEPTSARRAQRKNCARAAPFTRTAASGTVPHDRSHGC